MRDSALKRIPACIESARPVHVGEELMRDSALKRRGPPPPPWPLPRPPVGEELMRDSALKPSRQLAVDAVAHVGEELMRDSALKHPRWLLPRRLRRLSEKSSCATAL